MSYFIIYEDKDHEYSIKPKGLVDKIDYDDIKDHSDDIKNMTIQLNLIEKKENEYVDYLEKPVVLISDKLKQVFEKYKQNIFYRAVVLADEKNMDQDLYWQLVIKNLDCISNKSEFDKVGNLKKLVINENKIEDNKIFKIEYKFQNIIIVSLDIAESILRRDFTGIKLKRVETEVEGENG